MESINLGTPAGIQQYLEQAPIDEFNEIVQKMGVSVADLPGKGQKEKAQEVIAYLDRRNQLPDLTLTIMRSFVTKRLTQVDSASETQDLQIPPTWSNALSALNIQLESLQKQVEEIKEKPDSDEIPAKLEEITRTATAAQQLTADVVLPPADTMAVRLVPVHQLERLEEYRSDENWSFLFLGTFFGAILGIFSNWAANEPLTISRFSVILLILLVLLSSIMVAWLYRLRNRTNNILGKILSGTIKKR